MSWKSAVFSRDPEALAMITPSLQDLGIAAETISQQADALLRVGEEKFDAVIFDCDAAEGIPFDELLRAIRQGSLNSRLVVIAVVSDPAAMQPAFNQGANFVICKPLAADITRRTLRAATCVLYRMARRYPRRTVNSLSMVTIDDAADSAMIMQLAEGGMGIQALEPLEVSRSLKLRFEIPGTSIKVQATGEIAWADAAGRIGIRFSEIADQDQARLREWIFSDALDAMMPTSAASMASGSAASQASIGGRLLLTPAPQRLCAALLDGCIVLGATALFELLVLGLVRTAPHTIMAQATVLAIPCLFWSVYQYLFLRSVTPGTHIARVLSNLLARRNANSASMLLAPVSAVWRSLTKLGARLDMQRPLLAHGDQSGVGHVSIRPPAS
jgi:CheY-like chemotaxis protein